MTAEEQERLWRFIELSEQARIAYQTETAWELHDAATNKPYLRPALMPHWGIHISLPSRGKPA